MNGTMPETLFGDISSYICKAHSMLARGEWVDLKGLESDVEALCLSVSALSPEHAKEYAPELEYLREQMESLGAAIASQRDAVKSELRGIDTIERANKAYAQTKTLAKDAKP